MIHFTFSIQPEDCSRKDLDKEIPVLGVQDKLTRAIKSSQELTRAINLYFILLTKLISIYSSLFFGKAMNENEFETKERNLSKLKNGSTT